MTKIPDHIVVPELSKTQGLMAMYYTHSYDDAGHASATPSFHYTEIFSDDPIALVQAQVERFPQLYGCYYRVQSHTLIMCRANQSFDELRDEVTQAIYGDFPWSGHDFWSRHNHRSITHMPWFSVKHPGLLTYYQTDAKRAADIRTPIKAGKYLQKFYSDVLTAEQIQELGILFSTWATPVPLHITSDADEVEQVYVNGPHSCMAYEADHFAGFCHPSRVYAGPDLAVAYIGSIDKPEARAVVWPSKQLHSRIYGDTHRMTSALLAAGYKAGNMDGARIQRLFDPEHDCYVVPYVDDCLRAADRDGFLVLGSGHVGLRETCGLSEEPSERETCDQCEERVDADDIIWHSGERYCESCAGEMLFTCEMTGEREPTDDMLPSVNDRSFGATAQLRNLIRYCDATELYYPTNHARSRGYWSQTTYDFVDMADGTNWVDFHFETHGGTCSLTDENYPADELSTAPDGSLFHPDNAELPLAA